MTKKSSKKAKSQRSRERAFEEGAPQRRRNRCGSRYPLSGGPQDQDERPVRNFGVFTSDLIALCEWLKLPTLEPKHHGLEA